MRTSIIYIFYILILITGELIAQDRSDDEIMGRVSSNNTCDKRYFSIKTDLLTPIVNTVFYNRPTVCLSLEYGFCRRHAIQLTGQYGTYSQKSYSSTIQWVPGGPYMPWTTDVFQSRAELILDYKYYLKDSNDFKGFYCGLYLRGIDYTNIFYTEKGALTIDKVDRGFVGFCGGATIGYQIILKDHFVFDFLFGLGARNMFFTPSPYDKIHMFTDADIPSPLRTPLQLDIRTTINVGYKF